MAENCVIDSGNVTSAKTTYNDQCNEKMVKEILLQNLQIQQRLNELEKIMNSIYAQFNIRSWADQVDEETKAGKAEKPPKEPKSQEAQTEGKLAEQPDLNKVTDNSKVFCSYCCRKGHIINECRTKRRNELRYRSTIQRYIVCGWCGKQGHALLECRNRLAHERLNSKNLVDKKLTS